MKTTDHFDKVTGKFIFHHVIRISPLPSEFPEIPVFLSRETGISGNFVGRIKGAKCPFDLQFLTWDFS